MIGNQAVFKENRAFSVAFYPCNQQYELAIESGVTCKGGAAAHFINQEYHFGMQWFERYVHADNDVILEASPIDPIYEKDPYKLKTRRKELSHLKISPSYEQIIMMEYTVNQFEYTDQSRSQGFN